MVTLKNFIEGLENYTEQHQQLATFSWGNISNISTKDHTYSMMWLMPTQSEYDGSLTTMKFDMYIMDILEQDLSNKLNVMDSTLIIANDVVAYFWEDNYANLDFELDEENVTLQPFEGNFDDHLAGWIVSIQIQTKTNLNACITPIGDITPPTPTEPLAISATLVTPISVYGGTGEVLITATGGVEPYVGTGTYYPRAGLNTFVVTDAVSNFDYTSLTLTQPQPIPVVEPSGWYPPSYWPTDWDTGITDSDNGFTALVAVFPNKENYISFYIIYPGAGGTVDWGDGTTSALSASNIVNEKNLDYAGVSGTVTPLGYKIATVTINVGSNLSIIGYTKAGTLLATGRNYSTPYLAIKQRSQNATMRYYHNNPYVAGMLQYLDLGTDTPLLDIYVAFRAHGSLAKIIWKPSTVAFSANLAWGIGVIETTTLQAFNFNDIDWDLCTNMQSTFYSATGNRGVFEQSISNVTTLYLCFRSSQAFSSVILTNTGNVTTISRAVYQCSVSNFSMDDCSGVTNTALFTRNTKTYGQLTNVILSGLTIGVNISQQEIEADALDIFFTSLGTANGAQTITVTGNPGAATCDTTIATTKGWTVIV